MPFEINLQKINLWQTHNWSWQSSWKFCENGTESTRHVYSQVSDYNDVHRLYGADLYYHSTCMKNHVRKTESTHSSRPALDKAVALLTPAALSWTGYILSEVGDKVNKIIHPNQIYNYHVQSFLIQKLGEGIRFCPSTRKNKSFMFFQLIYQRMILLEKCGRQTSSKMCRYIT